MSAFFSESGVQRKKIKMMAKRMNKEEEEQEERCMNYGFTQAEVEELMCQGVKPYDDDAWDVLAALNGDDYY